MRIFRTASCEALLHAVVLIAGGVQLLWQQGSGPPSPGPRNLTFDQRVAAQRAIERVYYTYQLGSRLPFEEAVTTPMLEAKVRKYLKQSAALECFWNVPLTAEALSHEMARIAGRTRYSDRLSELYESLDRDTWLIQETFVRAALVDRLTRSFFSSDERIHSEARRLTEDLRTWLLRGGSGPPPTHDQVGVRIRRSLRARPQNSGVPEDALAPVEHRIVSETTVGEDDFEAWEARLVGPPGQPGEVLEESGGYAIPVLISRDDDTLDIRIYRIAKRDWDDWWSEVADSLDEHAVPPAASLEAELPGLSGPAGLGPTAPLSAASGLSPAAAPATLVACNADHRWVNGSLDDTPEPTEADRAVWTGSFMFVYTGSKGFRYDPLTDTWSFASTAGAPATGGDFTLIWAGASAIVWGGYDGLTPPQGFVNIGGRYDPVTDTWRPTSRTGAPVARAAHSAVWTGTEMIVWGGQGVIDSDHIDPLQSGGRYNPSTDTWRATTESGAPRSRFLHAAVWAASRMIVWGGINIYADDLGDGSGYDPVTDSWSPLPGAGAPTPRHFPAALWTGEAMLIWGGIGPSDDPLATGGRFSTSTNTWTPITTTGAPSAREAHTTVWAGDQMIVWGGALGGGVYFNTGARYVPGNNTWLPVATLNAPSGRGGHSAVWTGNQMIVWGGTGTGRLTNTGGRYDPSSDTWTPTSVGSSPAPRRAHQAAWTGNLMLIWGGVGGPTNGVPLADGSGYDPLVDAWSPMSSAGAPAGPGRMSAWTGREIIIFTGSGGIMPLSGGRYDPLADQWKPLTEINAPPRMTAPAVWTGERVLVWANGVGGQYDPQQDMWHPISTTGAPSLRSAHTGVWTGDRMIIWGGVLGVTNLNSGAQYDPLTDTWDPTSTVGAPVEREGHKAIWTGSRMIVWGGNRRIPSEWFNSGGIYDPISDTWDSTSAQGSPSARILQSMVWTGDHMLVWGGNMGAERYDSGGAYDPTEDSWLSLPLDGAPLPRDAHTAVWTGREMVVWGGSGTTGTTNLNSGGRYDPGNLADADHDGYRGCQGDCDDADPSTNPEAPETCDGRDNDCDGVVPPTEMDSDGDGFTGCSGDCDDAAVNIHPGATELPGNTADDDCDGSRLCEPSVTWKNHGTFVGCVARECDRLVASGSVSREACDALISKAARLRPTR